MQVIDPAFQSRVDFIIAYEDLTVEARREVWTNMIDRAGTEMMDLSAEDIDQLAEIRLNGREIKNLVKSAMLLDKDFGKVHREDLKTLAEMRLQAQSILGPDVASARLT